MNQLLMLTTLYDESVASGATANKQTEEFQVSSATGQRELDGK